MAVRITIKDGDVKFKAEGMAQAVHYAVCSTGKVILIVNDGKEKRITKYLDGKPVKREVRPVA